MTQISSPCWFWTATKEDKHRHPLFASCSVTDHPPSVLSEPRLFSLPKLPGEYLTSAVWAGPYTNLLSRIGWMSQRFEHEMIPRYCLRIVACSPPLTVLPYSLRWLFPLRYNYHYHPTNALWSYWVALRPLDWDSISDLYWVIDFCSWSWWMPSMDGRVDRVIVGWCKSEEMVW